VKAALGLGLLLFLGACTSLPDTPLEHPDLGTYVVTEFRLTHDERSATPWAQRLLGKSFVFGPDRILFPAEFGRPDCQHEGYRLTSRPSNFMPDFDLGEAGTLSAVDAGIEDRDLLEMWNGCVSGVYLSLDRGTMYLPGPGALLVLQKH
jgi:hypothetical protein